MADGSPDYQDEVLEHAKRFNLCFGMEHGMRIPFSG
jgi:hypothetical protein